MTEIASAQSTEKTSHQQERSILHEVLGINTPLEHLFLWNEDKKREYVSAVKKELEDFLEELNLGEDYPQNLTRAVINRFDDNTKKYQEGIIGPIHDEYHMAKVVHWAIQIWHKKKSEIPGYKYNITALAYVMAAIDHDLGDIPEENQAFDQSQRSEAKSANLAGDFINTLDWNNDDLKTELTNLVKLMISSTDQSLAISFQADNAGELPISNLILNQQSLRKTEEKIIILEAKNNLLEKRWSLDQIQSLALMLPAADYASYLLEEAWVLETLSLLLEKEEVYLEDKDGTKKLVIGQDPNNNKNYVDFLQASFMEKVAALYSEILPDQTQQALSVRTLISGILALSEVTPQEPMTDHLFRVEGGLTPRALFQIVESLDLQGNTNIQQALIEYSLAYRQNFSDPHAGNFAALATRVINLLIEACKKNNQLENLFTQISDKITHLTNQENTTINLHFSPAALGLDHDNLQTLLNKLSEKVNCCYLALRVDHGDHNSIDQYLDGLRSRDDLHIALADIPRATNMIKAIRDLLFFLKNQNISNKQIVVHAGLQEKPTRIFEAIQIANEDTSNTWQLHLDGGYQLFLEWAQSQKAQASDSKKPKLQVLISPLTQAMTNKETVATIRELQTIEWIDLQPSSNNPVLAGFGGLPLQELVMQAPENPSLLSNAG